MLKRYIYLVSINPMIQVKVEMSTELKLQNNMFQIFQDTIMSLYHSKAVNTNIKKVMHTLMHITGKIHG